MSPAEVTLILKARDEAKAVIGKFSKNLGGLSASSAKAGKAIAGGLALGGVGVAALGASFIASGVKINSAMEGYQTQLGTLLGSADQAKERIDQLRDFSGSTPFQIDEIIEAEKVLVGFGLNGPAAIEKTGFALDDLRNIIGDVSAGTGQKFQDLALTFSKFSAGASGEAISRLQELGVVTREELAEVGVEFSKSGQLMTPVPEAMEAALELAKEKFGGGMEQLSSTAAGKLSTFADKWDIVKAKFAEPIFDLAKNGLDGALAIVDQVSAKADELGPVSRLCPTASRPRSARRPVARLFSSPWRLRSLI